jgi:hypothetical protein
MKYFVRALKYFVYYFILLAVIMGILVLIKAVPSDVNEMFKNGYKSLWQIAGLFAIVSAIQPKFGYVTRTANIPGEYNEIRQGIIDFMQDHGYYLETENGENMTYRQKSFVNKIFRMFEDRLTFTRDLGGFTIEGSNRDMVRIIRGLEYKLRKENDDTDIDNQGNSSDDNK